MPFEFHFLRPQWLLMLLPLGLLLWRLARSDGEADAWRGVVDAHLLPRLLSGDDSRAARLPLMLLGAGWLLLVLALAGPTWERLPTPLYQAQQYRVIALDLSASMNATDLKPTRLAHARFEVLDILRRAGEGQTAMLAYGAEPYVVSPLTADTATIAAQVPLLDTGLLPVMGARRTDLVLDQAAALLRQAGAPEGEVILVSDGIEHPAAASEAAARVRAAGYRVSVLAVGTPKGAPVALGGGGFLKDKDGAIVLPQLDVDALSAVARAGGGRYVGASPDDRDIDALLSDSRARIGGDAQKQDATSDQWREEGPWLVLLLLPLAALAFRRGWLGSLLIVALVLPVQDGYAAGWDDLWLRSDQQAQRELESGRPAEAATLFERPDWRAAAAYQAGDFAAALESLEAQPGDAQAYNRGNALARLGRLQDAVAAYDQALAVDPADVDARHNRELVQRLLKQREQQAQRPPDAPQGRPAAQDQASSQSQDQEKGEQPQQSQDQEKGEQPQQSQDQEKGEQPQQSQDQEKGEQPQQGQDQAQQQQAGADDQQAEQSSQGGADEQDQQGEQSGQQQADRGQSGEQSATGQPQPGDEQRGGASAGSDSERQGGSEATSAQAGASGEGQQPGDQTGQPLSQAAGTQDDAPATDPGGQPGEQPSAAAEPRPADEPQDARPSAQPAPGEAAQQPSSQSGGEQPGREGGGEERQDRTGQAAAEQSDQPGENDAAGQQPGQDGTDRGGQPPAGSQPDRTAQEGEQAGAGSPDGAAQTPADTGSAQAGRQAEPVRPGGDQGQRDMTSATGGNGRDPQPRSPGLADLLGGERPGPGANRRSAQIAGGDSEDMQALEQMLRRVEDDPGGLLRQRFLLQHLRRSGQLP